MTCYGNYSYYPTPYGYDCYPDGMKRSDVAAGLPTTGHSGPSFGAPAAPMGAAGFPATGYSGPSFATPVVPMGTGQQLPVGRVEESFIENILRFNKNAIATFYFTYQGNNEHNSKRYRGRIETAGRDHIIISDPDNPNGKRHLLLMSNLDWVEFDGEVKYPLPQEPQVPLVKSR
ncbi:MULTISPECIES: spore coat protein GerQ [Paenibacillus]|uniref:spore coat protein GerQ n=1 Tax=Paenibacillus TaxID=44249 RepID=UPI0022B8CF3F|nr:spore coat protein GerQ [Paenibacillus caseinilyticus]MCZ8521006.1 spore coat protein GerQ [Paenibacillus caseinilyticus]